jgi:hypothetical protein
MVLKQAVIQSLEIFLLQPDYYNDVYFKKDAFS